MRKASDDRRIHHAGGSRFKIVRQGRSAYDLHQHCHSRETWPTTGVFERRSHARAYARSVAS
jgi:hypothetical protein